MTLLGLGRFAQLRTVTTLLLALNTTVQITLAVLISVRLLDPKDMKYLLKEQRSKRFQLVRCLVESGLLVAVALIIDLILFARYSNGHWIINICLPQLYAITTVIIVLRMDSFTDRQRSPLSGPSHSVTQQTNYPRGVAPSNVRSAVSSGIDDSHKSQIGDSHDGIELQGYHEEMRDIKTTDVYVHVEREVHHEV